MKRIVLCSVVLLWGILGVRQAYAVVYRIGEGIVYNVDVNNLGGANWDLLYNGGAEEGSLAGWYVENSRKMNVIASTENPAVGNYSFKTITTVDNPAVGGAALDYHYMSLAPGDYVLSALFYFDGTSQVGHVYLDFHDISCLMWVNGNCVPVNDNIWADPTVPGWQLVYGIFRVEGSTISAQPRVVRDFSFLKDTVVYVDEIALTHKDDFRLPPSNNNVVPEPMSLGMVMLGLFAGVTRKRTRKES